MSELEELKMELAEIKEILKTMQDEPKLLPIAKAAKRIGIGTTNFAKMVKFERDFPAIKNGNTWMVIMSEVDNWLSKNKRKKYNQ